MEAFHALVLGVVQGLGEFIPISSSGHLALFHWLFGWSHGGKADLAFDVSLHVGTLIALLVYFRKDWVDLVRLPSQRPMLVMVFIACIPGGLAGALLQNKAETVFRSPLHISLLLGLAGLAMWACDRVGRRERDMSSLTLIDAVWVGLSQALAIMPGVSRSGATISAGLLCGLTREAAARFSFLMSAPIIAGAAVFELRYFLNGFPAGMSPVTLGTGIAAAAVSGYLAIGFLLRYLRMHTLSLFVGYRVIVSCLMVAIYFVRVYGGS